jgi:uncharacterized protein YndB with AHSA1/START domain
MGTAQRRMAQACRVEVTVDATLESVWQLIADVPRTSEWSHECHHIVWLGGATAAAPGVRFRGRSRSGWLRWGRTCEVLAVDAGRQIAWRTIPTALLVDSTDWRISLEPAGAGTQIVQTFQMTKFPHWWEWILVAINPSHIDRSAALTEDLRRIGVIAAAGAPAAPATSPCPRCSGPSFSRP